MATKKGTSVQKQETPKSEIERTSSTPTFVPYTDIIENEDGLTIIMDLPGAENKNIDVNLEDNVLTVTAKIEPQVFEGNRLLYAEYKYGDFERSFKLNEDFNAEKIEAFLKEGVLTLVLPKAEAKKPRKIKIKTQK